MMDDRRRPTSALATTARFPTAESFAPGWLERLVPLAAAGGFGLLLLSDVIEPVALILLQVYLAF